MTKSAVSGQSVSLNRQHLFRYLEWWSWSLFFFESFDKINMVKSISTPHCGQTSISTLIWWNSALNAFDVKVDIEECSYMKSALADLLSKSRVTYAPPQMRRSFLSVSVHWISIISGIEKRFGYIVQNGRLLTASAAHPVFRLNSISCVVSEQ